MLNAEPPRDKNTTLQQNPRHTSYEYVMYWVGCKRGPAATWAASAGPEDHNSEVRLYDTGIK